MRRVWHSGVRRSFALVAASSLCAVEMEIRNEGIIRFLPVFSSFLMSLSLSSFRLPLQNSGCEDKQTLVSSQYIAQHSAIDERTERIFKHKSHSPQSHFPVCIKNLYHPQSVTPNFVPPTKHLNLHLRQPLLPHNNIRRNTILSVVQQHNHRIRIHRLSSEELIVLEVCNDLLGVGGSSLFESGDLGLGGVALLEGLLDLLHVLLEVGEVGLLVEGGFVEAEGVDHVDNLRGAVFGAFFGFFGGGVGASV
jgi:hypothetical protein